MKRGKIKKFGRITNQRQAFLKSLATAMISHAAITTTRSRAKILAGYMDKLVTIAKKNSLSGRRNLSAVLNTKIAKIFTNEIIPKLSVRSSGYTRTVPLSQRKSDGAQMARIEFIV